MASGIFAVLDDIALLLDDTAAMSKIAAKKTAGILGDDLAVNAEQATGFNASRELPVVWAITRGSLINKLIIVPLALLLSSYLPWLIVPILLVGGAYLSYEGVEKVLEWFGHHAEQTPHPVAARDTSDRSQLLKQEASKIKSAVRTDFILSIEIVVLALGTVLNEALLVRILVVSLIALVATIGVYGLVALLVRMDDAGLWLIDLADEKQGGLGRLLRAGGNGLVAGLPWVIRLLGIVGTIAMLLVGGGMYVHNLHWVHELLASWPASIASLLCGLVVGSLVLGAVLLSKRLSGTRPA